MSYKILYSLESAIYKEGSPVVIQSGALVMNSENGQLHVQIKFKNVTNKIITMLKAQIIMLDTMGREISRGEKQYLDLMARCGDSFAGQEPVYLKDNTVRKFLVNVVEVCFNDNSIYSGDDTDWEKLPTQSQIQMKFNGQALEEFKTVYCAQAKFLPFEHKDIWFCACGEINKKTQEKCYKCNANFNLMQQADVKELKTENVYKKACVLVAKNKSVEILQGIEMLESILTHKDSKQKIEVAKQHLENVKKSENEAQILKQKKAKKNKRIAIASACACIAIIILIVLTANVFVPNAKFKKAQNLISEKNYTEAYIILNELTTDYDNYKNAYGILCESKYVRANEYIAKGEDAEAYAFLKQITAYKESRSLIADIKARAKNKAMQFAEKQDFQSAVAVLETVDVTEEDFSIMRAYNAMVKHDFGTAVKAGITDMIIPDGVTTIDSYEFKGCTLLTSVVIPDSVTSIGSYAFYHCDSLTSVEIGGSVTSIGDRAFQCCDKLVEVINKSSHITVTKGSSSNGYVGHYALSVSNCDNTYVSKLTKDNGYIIYTDGAEKILVGYSGTETALTLPSYVTKIYQYAFYEFDGLTSVVIGDSVTSIGNSAFSGCSGLTSIKIPNSVTSIGDSAFYGCSGLVEMTLPFIGASKDGTRNTHFGYIFGASSYSKNNSYVSSSLKKVTLTGGSSIGDDAFYNCDSLTSVVIGDSVTSIGNMAFFYCDSLTSVVIGDSVTSIGDDAFSGCCKLVEVINKSSHITVTKGSSSNGYVGYYALSVSNCDNTYVSKLTNDNGYIIYTDGAEKVLVGYSGTETALILPSYVTKIYQYAFESCNSLTSVVIGDSVTSIGDRAFWYCSSLTSIKYRGTQSQWNAIKKSYSWNDYTGNYTITYNYVGE